MSNDPILKFVEQMRQSQLLDAVQFNELERLRETAARPAQLASELVRRGWITPHQANQVAMGRGAGLLLGSYIVLEPIGGGGMGQVVKARHRYMHRNVALKLIRQDQRDSADVVERFQRETRLLADLRHPHIVQAYDAGLAGDVWFLAMELLEGIDLAGLVQQRGRLPVGLACEYIRQAALGLQHAHQRGLVHRDIKPSNLFLTAEGVKLLDLGLARPQAGDGQGGLTQTNSVMGTPDYLAPEQAIDPRKAGTRSDLYSLGCTLYFLLSGRPPFPEGTLAQKLLYHQQAEPVPIEKLRPEMPPALTVLLRRMLAKRPEDRPANAAEVAAQLAPLSSLESASPIPSASSAGTNRGPSLLHDPTVPPPLLPASTLQPKPAASGARAVFQNETVLPTAQTATLLGNQYPATMERSGGLAGDTLPVPASPPSPSAPGLFGLSRKRLWMGAAGAGFFLVLIGLIVFWTGGKTDPASPEGWGHSPRIEGPPLHTLNMNKGLMAWLSISRDGKTLSATSLSGYTWYTVLWDTQKGARIGELEKAACAEFSPDGKYLACGGERAEVRLLDPATHALIQSFTVDSSLNPIRGMRFSANGSRLLCYGHGNPSVWDFKENGLLRRFPRVDDYREEFYRASLCDLSPDGKLFATGLSTKFQVMQVDKADHYAEQFFVPQGVISTAFSRDGKYLAAGLMKGGVSLENVLSQDGWPQVSKGEFIQLRIPMPRSLAFHPKTPLLVAGSEEGILYLTAADKGWEVSELRAHNDAVTVVCFSQDGKMLATGDRRGTIKLWEVKR